MVEWGGWGGFGAGPLCGGGLQADAGPQMVYVGSDDHGPRHLFVRPEWGGRTRGIHRCHRPQFPPAGTRARLRQQPRRAYVAGKDPAGEISLKRNGGNATKYRAADDFTVIRARMEGLRRVLARPPAADDFSVIPSPV